MTCGQCIAFAPNLLDEAHTSWSRYKCMMCGHMVLASDEACHLFGFDPVQDHGKDASVEDNMIAPTLEQKG